VERADRAAVLIDSAAYFEQLEWALRAAKHSVLIAGWDFDASIRLRPGHGEEQSPSLGRLLNQMLDANPELTIHIMIWSLSLVHAPGASRELIFGADWQKHPRLHLRLDSYHPRYAAHHQKIVVVDDCLAFVGGIDLTVERWDTPEHAPDEPLRRNPAGEPYKPVHDLQMVVDGPAASAVAELVRERWKMAFSEELPLCADKTEHWPDGLTADFSNVPVAIARTLPAYRGQKEITEVAELAHDAIRAAKSLIYIEAQYFTARSIGRTLASRLREPDGPEIVIVLNHRARGLIERFSMGMNSDRLIRKLRKADHYNRLRVCYPYVSDGGTETDVFMHAKLIAIDDRFIKIGSANFNNRSIGVDSECDLAIDADRAATAQEIRAVRIRLLAEHLGCRTTTLARILRECGSTIATIDRVSSDHRGLRTFDAMHEKGPTRFLPGSWIFDPKRVFRLFRR
jgi:phosphatidylserine/phosphatidylglycerophosphate/cardiolipin synthase-like enzyme